MAGTPLMQMHIRSNHEGLCWVVHMCSEMPGKRKAGTFVRSCCVTAANSTSGIGQMTASTALHNTGCSMTVCVCRGSIHAIKALIYESPPAPCAVSSDTRRYL